MLRFFLIALAIFVGSQFSLNAQQKNPLEAKNPILQKAWVDSVYQNLTLDEKIGQLFMADVFSSKGKPAENNLAALIKNYHIGGIIFSKGGPGRQAKMHNRLQEKAKVPLLIGMDAEWGLAMRLDSTYSFPWNMTLGAIQDPDLIYEAGKQIAKHNKRLGVHFNFAPVVDVNINPANPIIGNRSFGENVQKITQQAIAFMQGMHSENVLSSAKHFPGHGDTHTDSHKSLPFLDFTRQRLDSVELFPFRELIKNGVSSIMVGHLNVPALQEDNIPTSLSKAVITDLLKTRYQYKGLIFTDALNMRGVADFDEPGEIDLAAFKAGNDILLISENIPAAHQRLKAAYVEKEITEERLAHSVKKILMAKYKAGLHEYKPIKLEGLHEDLNAHENDVIYEELIEKAITLIKNDKAILPVQDLEKKKIAYVKLGEDSGEAFLKTLNKYTQVDEVKADSLSELLEKLKAYNLVIVGHHTDNANPWKSYKYTLNEKIWLYEIARKNEVILASFARPYSIIDLKTTININAIILGYQNSKLAQEKVAQAIFGGLSVQGKLPVSLGKEFPEGTGFILSKVHRLSYGMPESVGMRSINFKEIDSILNDMVKKKMAPGAQVLIARKGRVVYDKNVGFHTYEKKKPVTSQSIYDLASLTKILATLPLVMEQYEKGILNLDTTLAELIEDFKDSNKANIDVKSMLSHYAQLKAWIPFYIGTLDSLTNKASKKYFRKERDLLHNIQVADKMFMRTDYADTLFNIIKESPLRTKKNYKYSDLPYYILKHYLEEYYEQSLADLTQKHFYEPLGANFTGYLPLNRFKKQQITPSEDDNYWREQRVQGYVHDQGAAMQGGVGGHAGLFSNANDVAKLMQVYLNGGTYGGKRFFKPSTISSFNTCYYCDEDVRRGVGFDKPQLGTIGPTCGCLSMNSFGHSGFTGTYAWADPEEQIVYVFLSNRTFPDAGNRLLITEDVRTKIQAIIYKAIIN
ncbi:glycoside hydrolase family 3 N-terminal domain-containing protein [Mesonia sediminis]|uniref:beta-N-acetylhexosaminidase n=1 Tax=Mesonia sediminis TaxID=1703946 RepID=A0ABW5SCQ1_9FLAO